MYVFSFLLLFIRSELLSGQTGVFLSIRGAIVDNDGYVNIEDIYIGYRGSNSNTNSLLCHTNAKGCCRPLSNKVPGRGQWFLSNGSIVLSNAQVGGYLRNRGAGVVRLYRELFSGPAERGRFQCEIPDVVNVNLTLYANILDIGPVSVSPSGFVIPNVGVSFSLECSANIVIQPDSPPPYFEWFYGPTNDSLPSGVTVSNVTTEDDTYTSILHFSSLSLNHTGMYTCRLGGNRRLAANTILVVHYETTEAAAINQTLCVQDMGASIPTDKDCQPTNSNKYGYCIRYTGTIIGITVAIVIMLSVIIFVIVIFAATRRYHQRRDPPEARVNLILNQACSTANPDSEEVDAPSSAKVYNVGLTDSVYYEYTTAETFCKQVVQSSAPVARKSIPSEYMLTQCPAYVTK